MTENCECYFDNCHVLHPCEVMCYLVDDYAKARTDCFLHGTEDDRIEKLEDAIIAYVEHKAAIND